MSIAEELLPPVLSIAEERNARVTEVWLQAGEMQGIVPESLEMAFTALSEGTAAEGAILHVEPVKTTARCRRCGREFTVEDAIFLCPDCGVADVQTLTGNELLLTRLELEPCE